MAKTFTEGRLSVISHPPSQEDVLPTFAEAVKEGLSNPHKSLPFPFFYNDEGSQIFEKITELPEYYLTKCENQILKNHSLEIAQLMQDVGSVIVELGSGSSTKTRTLLSAFTKVHSKVHYVPIDISRAILEESSRQILSEYPQLKVTAHHALYQQGLNYMKNNYRSGKLICFFGSSIGNFTRSEALKFVKEVRETMGSNDKLLIGIDLKKDIKLLEAAYNDSQGVTADFNINLLKRINSELSANFDISKFRHIAPWNEKEGRIEMRLESLEDQDIFVEGLNMNVHFTKGETIHTENCTKYSLDEIERMASQAGMRVEKYWLDETKKFSLSLMVPEPQSLLSS